MMCENCFLSIPRVLIRQGQPRWRLHLLRIRQRRFSSRVYWLCVAYQKSDRCRFRKWVWRWWLAADWQLVIDRVAARNCLSGRPSALLETSTESLADRRVPRILAAVWTISGPLMWIWYLRLTSFHMYHRRDRASDRISFLCFLFYWRLRANFSKQKTENFKRLLLYDRLWIILIVNFRND